MMKEYKFKDSEAFIRELENTIKRMEINHPNILHFYDFSSISYTDTGYHKFIIR